MDFVKLSGIVDGSLRSRLCQKWLSYCNLTLGAYAMRWTKIIEMHNGIGANSTMTCMLFQERRIFDYIALR